MAGADQMPTEDLTPQRLRCESRSGNTWGVRPGGYPHEIEARLIDAVLSIRARYDTTADTGVPKRVRD